MKPVTNAAHPTPRLPQTPFTASRIPVCFQRAVTIANPTGW